MLYYGYIDFERKDYMWTSVYLAQDKDKAQKLKNAIEKMNIIVMMRSIRMPDKAVDDCYEILVPRAELEKALDVIISE